MKKPHSVGKGKKKKQRERNFTPFPFSISLRTVVVWQCLHQCCAILDVSSCTGRCGAGYSREHDCQCDFNCHHYMECCPDFRKVCTVGKFPNTASSSPNSSPNSLPHQCLLSECLNVCLFAVSLSPLIHVLLSPSNTQDNLLQSKENCISTGYCQAKSFAFYKSTTRQDRQKQFTVCFQLLSAFVLYMSVSYSKKKSSKSQFRVLQKEILTYSNSNSRSMDAVGSNPKPGCPSMDRNWLWIRTMSRVCGKRWLDEY